MAVQRVGGNDAAKASSSTRPLMALMPIAATGISRDQDHRRALQPILAGRLPRADRHHVGLRRRLDDFLPDGRASTCRLDEAACGRVPCGLALRDRQTRWQRSLGREKLSHKTLASLSGCPLCPRKRTSESRTAMYALGRFCCRSPLKMIEVGDSVAVVRFATGAEHDGAA